MKKLKPAKAILNQQKRNRMLVTCNRKRRTVPVLKVDILKNDAYLSKNGIAVYLGLKYSINNPWLIYIKRLTAMISQDIS